MPIDRGPTRTAYPPKGDSAPAAAIDVTGSATLIAAANGNRVSISIQNVGTVPIYLGQSTGVTTANGLTLPGGTALFYDSDTIGPWYGIVASGTVSVRVMEVD